MPSPPPRPASLALLVLLVLTAAAWPSAPRPAAASPAEENPAQERARFAVCGPGPRVTCVVDGDTFWLRRTKIRIADINAPEVGHPACADEARLGAAATRRLTELLNAGPFTLTIEGSRATDRYGRALRVVMRDGESLGLALEREGLAERWKGRRGDWCAGAGQPS
ncbi:thermonuclease family protein [Novosphingobium huizhouense]|uniref:thermonuclease family protein n=1 Tax=Novosphingobium huizhouense TaxID=2866625 RepID=UPI001CD90371|nr:thermonuclease family protein [Novosphingobium huizhouense]